MIKFSKFALPLSGGAIAALLLLLTAPKVAHAVAAALVEVTNTSANPVIISSIEEKGRTPYASQLPGSCSSSLVGAECTAYFPKVPANQRLVVEHIAVFGASSGTKPDLAQVNLQSGPGQSYFTLPLAQSGTTTWFSQDYPVLGFVDSGDTPLVIVIFRVSSSSLATIDGLYATISGYLVNCSAASCAPIVSN